MRDYYRRQYGWGDDRVTTIWNGLDLNQFSATPLQRHPDEPLRLLCIGRVDRNKNWHLLAEAAARLAARDGIRLCVSIVGRKDPNVPDEFKYRDELLAALRRHNLEDNWTFLGERNDISRLFASHHALAHPSSVEGLSDVVCESLACGRPVIAADAFDHRLLIQEGETGWLFDHRSADNLADALRRLNAQPSDQLARMGQAARRFAEENLTVARLADEYEALFKKLVAQRANANSADAACGRDRGRSESTQPVE
jgi:glycosyltransferase involved in cell wall biosynthesis